MTEIANSSPAPKPPESGGTYLALAILATLFCCLPFGIPAIVFAAQIDGKLRSGDTAGAIHSAKQAKVWIIVSAATGFGVLLLYVVLIFAGVLTGVLKH